MDDEEPINNVGTNTIRTSSLTPSGNTFVSGSLVCNLSIRKDESKAQKSFSESTSSGTRKDVTNDSFTTVPGLGVDLKKEKNDASKSDANCASNSLGDVSSVTCFFDADSSAFGTVEVLFVLN